MHGIKVLMAKNYIDNLSEEVRKGMREKAEQGHWPTVAHVGYLNNSETHRIEIDPVRAPLVTKLFEWYARGDVSLKEVDTPSGRGRAEPSACPAAPGEVTRFIECSAIPSTPATSCGRASVTTASTRH